MLRSMSAVQKIHGKNQEMFRSAFISRLALGAFTSALVLSTSLFSPSAFGSPSSDEREVNLSAFAEEEEAFKARIVELVGAASEAELDPKALIASMERMKAQRSKIAAVIPRVDALWTAVINDGTKKAARARRLLGRVDAHHALLVALESATLRRSASQGLACALVGGEDLGGSFRALGKLLRGRVLVGIASKEFEEVRDTLNKMARFGALIVGSACTLDELSSGLRLSQDALTMMWRLSEYEAWSSALPRKERLSRARRTLATYSKHLRDARRALGPHASLPSLLRLASESGRSLWRYEALKTLRGLAWSGLGTEQGAEAERHLNQIVESAQAPADVKAAASKTLVKLRASR